MVEAKGKPLGEGDIVVHVPRGQAGNVRVQEATADQPHEITIQISKRRKPTVKPVLGVIVK